MNDHDMPGTELTRGFYEEIVAPVLAESLPWLKYAAARLGSGSDVLGLDDAISRDHDWGCRLTLLVDAADGGLVRRISDLLERRLPEGYRGLPVRFPATWDPRRVHRVEVATVGGFAASHLGVDPIGGLSVLDWVLLTGQSVLEVTAGPVFADRTVELGRVRQLLRWYPRDVERYVLAAAWRRLERQLPFVGRTAERGDELGSRLLSAELTGDLMWLAFVLCRRWPPYAKWRGIAFRSLPVAADLAGPLDDAATARDWRAREDALVTGIEVLVAAQHALGLPVPASGVTRFRGRPYCALNDQIWKDLLEGIVDPEVARLPRGIGCVERWIGGVGLLASPRRRAALHVAYSAWSALDPSQDDGP
jgi:hypothetical protein